MNNDLIEQIHKESMLEGKTKTEFDILTYLDTELSHLRKTVFTMKYIHGDKWCIYKFGEEYIEVNSPYISVVNTVMIAYEDSYRSGKSDIIGDIVEFIKEK